jgi:hypothetical protein
MGTNHKAIENNVKEAYALSYLNGDARCSVFAI